MINAIHDIADEIWRTDGFCKVCKSVRFFAICKVIRWRKIVADLWLLSSPRRTTIVCYGMDLLHLGSWVLRRALGFSNTPPKTLKRIQIGDVRFSLTDWSLVIFGELAEEPHPKLRRYWCNIGPRLQNAYCNLIQDCHHNRSVDLKVAPPINLLWE